MNRQEPLQNAVWPVLTLLVHLLLVLIFAVAYIGAGSGQIDIGEGIGLVSWVLVLVSVWLAVSWRLASGSLLNPYGLFLLGSMPFHLGYAFLRIFGQQSMIWLQGSVTEAQVLSTLVYVLACYLMLHLGALTVVAATQGERPRPSLTFDGTRVYQIGWLLLAIATVPLLFRIREGLEVVMSGGYSSLFEGGGRDPSGTSGLIALVAEFYLPGVMFLLAGSRHRRLGQVVSLLALVLYSGSYLFMGFRAFSLIPVAVYVWLWHRCIRPLPVMPVAATGVGLFLLVAPLVRRIRDMSGVDRLSFDVLWEAYAGADNPILSLVAELAGSILTISFTAELVPEVRPYEMGFGYLRSLVNAVPMLQLPDTYGYAGSWLAWHVTPHLAVGGFGLGFSFMAEAYLNFGWVGGAVTVAFIGAAIVAVQRWAERSGDPVRFAFIAGFLPILIFFTRGETLSITRPILWYSLIPMFMVWALRAMDRRLSAGRPRANTAPGANTGLRANTGMRANTAPGANTGPRANTGMRANTAPGANTGLRAVPEGGDRAASSSNPRRYDPRTPHA